METLVAATLAGVASALATFAFLQRDVNPLLARGLGRTRRDGRDSEGETSAKPFSQRVVRPVLRWVGSCILKFFPSQVINDLRLSLQRAGIPVNPTSFIGQWALGILLPPLVITAVMLAFAPSPVLIGISVTVALAPGIVTPLLWLQQRAHRRKHLILKALPDFADLVAVSVEAGLGLEAALARVANKTPGPLAEEMKNTLRQIALGMPRQQALLEMGQRCGVEELGTFLSAIVQAEQLGVGIAQALHVQADHLRMLRRQRAETRAQQAPVKMIFPLVFLIFPAMMLVVLGPGVIRLWQSFASGQIGVP